MEKVNVIRAHDREALEYDQQVREYNCYVHDALFGMSFEYVNPGECLLDIGIGTGLASLPFAKLGLEVFGFDGSTEMLRVCESKAFTKELKVFDLQNMPLPYPDSFFNHVICCGVLHFFGDLEAITKEVVRVIKPRGIFCFSVVAQDSQREMTTRDTTQDYLETPTAWGTPIYKHSGAYVTNLLEAHSFDMLKSQKLLIRSGPGDNDDMLFMAYVAREASALRT